MRYLVAFICVCVAILFIGYTDLLRHLAFFIMTGQIPFTKVAFPSLFMMALWFIIIPFIWMSRRSVTELFWWIMEIVGEKHQRYLNQTLKLRSDHVQLYTIALLSVAQQDESESDVAKAALLPAAS